MAFYLRKQIRDQFKSILSNVQSVNGRVYYDYLYAVPDNKMPCLIVTTGDEPCEDISIGNPTVVEKNLTILIHVISLAKTNYQDTIDEVALEVETLLRQNKTLDNLVTSVKINNILNEVDDEREIPLAIFTFTIAVKYRVLDNNLSVSI